MQVRCAVAVVVLSAGMMAQSAPPDCPAGRPVDEIIAEVHKQHSSDAHRNANPLPSITCIFGWCRDVSRTPPAVPPPAPKAKPSTEEPASTHAASGDSSSGQDGLDACDQAMGMALKAAHDVDVGDYYFQQHNYHAALSRYQAADNEKPQDVAIQVRLGRTFEKLKKRSLALEHYEAAAKLPSAEHWSQEARSAAARLQASKNKE